MVFSLLIDVIASRLAPVSNLATSQLSRQLEVNAGEVLWKRVPFQKIRVCLLQKTQMKSSHLGEVA